MTTNHRPWLVTRDQDGYITLPPEVDVYPGQRFLARQAGNNIRLIPVALLSQNIEA